MIFMLSVLIPFASLIARLSPVARIASPVSVLKKNTSRKTISKAIHKPTIKTAVVFETPNDSTHSKIVGCPSNEILGAPITREVTEYKPVMVMIPASNAGIFSLV
ncbi:hypothetical protein SDC9_95868 [bioreactor metagenome]|uniref:Uncharacterized protein n=1 Tax=bioreactor metagenome TaxID=1076179 RepID=A0A645A7J3_9ZZZZ